MGSFIRDFSKCGSTYQIGRYLISIWCGIRKEKEKVYIAQMKASKYILLTIIVLCGVVMGVIFGSVTFLSPHKASAASLGTVIFVHCFNPDAAMNCNMPTEFGTIKTYFQNGSGSRGSFQTQSVGYYNGDTNCDYYLTNVQHCSSFYSGNNGTINEDIRHISCRLAWYIWDNYSIHNTYVQVVAHSMGGFSFGKHCLILLIQLHFLPIC
jgi:hypothetical protein